MRDANGSAGFASDVRVMGDDSDDDSDPKRDVCSVILLAYHISCTGLIYYALIGGSNSLRPRPDASYNLAKWKSSWYTVVGLHQDTDHHVLKPARAEFPGAVEDKRGLSCGRDIAVIGEQAFFQGGRGHT